MLEVSDNEGAEVLARHVGLAVADDGSFAGGAAGVRQTLAGLGVPLDGAVVHDGSGLSRANRLRTDTLIEVLRVAADPDHPELRAVLTGLPVGGFTGSLAVRFDDAVPAGVGRVRAKTGTLTGVRSLAGHRRRPERDAAGVRPRRRPARPVRHPRRAAGPRQPGRPARRLPLLALRSGFDAPTRVDP